MKPAKVRIYRHLRSTEPSQFLPFYLPDREHNKVSITSKIVARGGRLPVISWRNGIFMGMTPTSMQLSHNTKIHYLKDEHGTYMSSIPQEMEQAARQIRRAHGQVLIGGLGLGIVVSLLEKNPKVTKITVCEINRDVIDLIMPYLPHNKTEVLVGDLHQYLKSWKKLNFTFDFGYFDIWRGTGEYDFWKYVIPLRRLSEGVVPQDNLECWNELEMIGQIHMGCQSMINLRHTEHGKQIFSDFNDTDRKPMAARWAFIQYLKQRQPSDEIALQALRCYLKALKNPALFDRDWAQYVNNKPEIENHEQ